MKKKYIVFILALFLIPNIILFYSSSFLKREQFAIKDNYDTISSRGIIPSAVGSNIALNRPCWVESEWSGYNKEYANDGTKGVWDNGWRADSEHSSSWWKVQFDGDYEITNVKIWFQQDSPMGSYEIQVSDTGTFTGEHTTIASGTGNTELTLDITISNGQGEYLRLYGTVIAGPNTEPLVQEVEVYGTIVTDETPEVPTKPVLNSISPNPSTTGTIILNWNDVSNTDNYTIYRSTSLITQIDGTLTILSTTTNSYYTDTVGTDGTYYYTVIAENIGGSSELANSRSVVVTLADNGGGGMDPFLLWAIIGVVSSMIIGIIGLYIKYKK